MRLAHHRPGRAAGARSAINGPAFLAYVRQFLAPVLSPGDVVVLDNLSSHKVSGVREAIEARDATLLYLRDSGSSQAQPYRQPLVFATTVAGRHSYPAPPGAIYQSPQPP
jgi:transposase